MKKRYHTRKKKKVCSTCNIWFGFFKSKLLLRIEGGWEVVSRQLLVWHHGAEKLSLVFQFFLAAVLEKQSFHFRSSRIINRQWHNE